MTYTELITILLLLLAAALVVVDLVLRRQRISAPRLPAEITIEQVTNCGLSIVENALSRLAGHVLKGDDSMIIMGMLPDTFYFVEVRKCDNKTCITYTSRGYWSNPVMFRVSKSVEDELRRNGCSINYSVKYQ